MTRASLALHGKYKATCSHESVRSDMHVSGAVVCHFNVSSQAKHKLQRREVITYAYEPMLAKQSAITA